MIPTGCVFDLDGTVVDSHAYTFAAFRYALAPFEIVPSDAEIHARFGPPESAILATFVPTPASASASAYLRLQEYYAQHARDVRVHPKLPAVLRDCRRAGIACGLFTGRARDSTTMLLRATGLEAAFDAIVAGDEPETRPKPAADGVVLLAARFGRPASRLLVVGDSPLDLEAAAGAGARGLLATWFPLPQRRVPAGVACIDDPDALRTALGLPGLSAAES